MLSVIPRLAPVLPDWNLAPKPFFEALLVVFAVLEINSFPLAAEIARSREDENNVAGDQGTREDAHRLLLIGAPEAYCPGDFAGPFARRVAFGEVGNRVEFPVAAEDIAPHRLDLIPKLLLLEHCEAK